MMKNSFDKADFIIKNKEIYDIETLMQCYFKAYDELIDIDYFIVADKLLDELIKEEIERSIKHGE